MALVKVKDILKHATEHKYGVAAINTINVETIKYAILAAEQEKVPLIVQFYPGFSDYMALKYISYTACDMAHKVSVPIGVHLDHSNSFDIAVSGIRDGFPSVMVDGSSLPYDENVALTKAVAKVARVFGVDVEAELGHVGSGENLDDIIDASRYTNVDQAVGFVEKTGCDALAVAVGNAHGPYVKTPNLDFQRIAELRAAVSVPLVLHGCSDIPEEQIREAVNLGMSKFNIATEYFRAMYRSFENTIVNGNVKDNGIGLLEAAKEDMIAFVVDKIRLLNPNKFSL
ncbi:class II fructose-bisphosphate aldolase [Novisyntrophococcus fermenticellae]|uniref:class II fructose-bisphosphate aldolase n=1 Tax=Novisyntrophococcus fermenticellae TaxID=2068655 RepID=UPI001E518960|nr:class II fructose-bisphosphate aldolase [Novisyntrophococcus fermenticellae]